MPALRSAAVTVELDPCWPRPLTLRRNDSGAVLSASNPSDPFSIVVDGHTFSANELGSTQTHTEEGVRYLLTCGCHRCTIDCSLVAQDLTFSLDWETGENGDRPRTVSFEGMVLARGQASRADSYLRHTGGGFLNWDRSWCPGTPAGGFGDHGSVQGASVDRIPQPTATICLWNEGICIALLCSQRTRAFMSAVGESPRLPGRGEALAVWPDAWVLSPGGRDGGALKITMGILGDYNGNGSIDWCDAAAWEGDKGAGKPYRYEDTVLYKLYLDDVKSARPLRTFEECLKPISMVHAVSGGMQQIVYLVGWQYEGHDTGYPSWNGVNERCGGRDGLLRLMQEARHYNCRVSLHVNLDDAYEGYPEFDEQLLCRDPEGLKVWFTNYENGGRKVYGINHTLAMESGYHRDRLERLCSLLPPLEHSIHCDAHRCWNAVWLSNGRYIDAESETRFGMEPLRELFLSKGLDITTEGIGHSHRGGSSWGWHMGSGGNRYGTVLDHGRVAGANRPGPEGEGLGCVKTVPERGPDSWDVITENFFLHWMYARILFRKKMLRFERGDWNEGVEAWYEDATHMRSARGGATPLELEAHYEGIPIARGSNRFLPWREDEIWMFSKNGGATEWTLPASWIGRTITAESFVAGQQRTPPRVCVEGSCLRCTLEGGVPVRLVRA